MFEEHWKRYSRTWSMSAPERDAELRELVADEVTYTDPTTAISGRETFSGHMANFQKSMPGCFFEILSVNGHHGQTLANWRLVGGDGAERMRGTSYARLADDGRFAAFTGFF